MSYLYVPGMEGSALDSKSQCQLLAPSVSWRGKLRAAPLWLRGCKRDRWLKHLFGQTSQPSTASLGVERWISSLLESRVSPGASQESKQDLKTSDILGKSLSGWLAKWSPDTSSLRTSPGLFDSEPPIFSGDFPKSGSMRSGAFFRQRESAQLIDGNGSSCWPIGEAWPTPDALMRGGFNTGGGTQEGATPRPTLTKLGKMWPTATAGDAGGSGSAAYSTDSGRHAGTTLTDAGKAWPTPRAGDPGSRKPGTGGAVLGEEAKKWATPKASDPQHAGPNMRDSSGGMPLPAQAVNWPTPNARDHKGSPNPENRDRMTGQLDEAAERLFPPVPTESGAESPKSTTQRLNPKFVEWLMGLPDGWTSSGCSATELSRYKRLMRFALYSNESPTNHE